MSNEETFDKVLANTKTRHMLYRWLVSKGVKFNMHWKFLKPDEQVKVAKEILKELEDRENNE